MPSELWIAPLMGLLWLNLKGKAALREY